MSLRKLPGIIALMMVAAACTPTANKGDKPLVVTTAWPVASLVRQIVGDRVQVVDLARPGVEPHDLELTASDRATLASADVVVYVGGGFQPTLAQAVPKETGVDVLEGIAATRASDDRSDPHIWLDPSRWASVARDLGSELAERLGDRSFATDSIEPAAELDLIDEQFSTGLVDCDRDVVVTEHAAFGYMTSRYGLVQEGVTGIVPGAEATASRLAELQKLIATHGVTTVFAERGRGGRLAEALAETSDVIVAELDPLEFSVDDSETYESRMAANLAALRGGLGCR